MWFKNLRAYRLTAPFSLSPEQLAPQLESKLFAPCAQSSPLAMGWVSPLGEGFPLAHGAQQRLLVCMRREERVLPSTVVREMVEERIAGIEAEQSRKVYRRERLELRDEIVRDCLPRAFTRSTTTYACIDQPAGWIYVDAASANRAEELLNLLRESLGSLPVRLPETQQSALVVMTAWLARRNLPEGLSLTGECELRAPGDGGAVVRTKGLDLLEGEVETHLESGLQVSKLALSFQEQVSFVLAEDLTLKRLRFADSLREESDGLEADPAARIDADFVLLTDALATLQQALMAWFGGELQRE
jgi:recombination associated protein RdgC